MTISKYIKQQMVRVFGFLSILGRTDSIPELRHLNFSLLGAFGQSIINKEINQKILDNYFADRLIFVPALPKSASSVIGECVSVIQATKSLPGHKYSSVRSGTGNGMLAHAKYMIPNWDPNLRPEVVQDFPEGGVLKYHMHPNAANLKVLNLLDAKYVIVFRHPADQLVASYCHYSSQSDREAWMSGNGILYDPVYPLAFGKKDPPNEILRYMIEDGYLAAVLKWSATWLSIRSEHKSTTVRYEDFFTKQQETLRKIGRFLEVDDLGDSTIEQCGEVANISAFNRKSELNLEKYQKGWSGKIGVWKDYLSNDHAEAYRATVENFLRLNSNGSLLLNLYPDLLEIY